MRCLGGHDVGSRTVTRIGKATLTQLLEIMLVYFATLTLPVWTFVPVESEPVEVVHDKFGILAVRALGVDVFYAQQPFAALRFGRQPRKQSTERPVGDGAKRPFTLGCTASV